VKSDSKINVLIIFQDFIEDKNVNFISQTLMPNKFKIIKNKFSVTFSIVLFSEFSVLSLLVLQVLLVDLTLC
jgi:hypothetical protein